MAKLMLTDLEAQLAMCVGPSALPIVAGTDGLSYIPASMDAFVAPVLADRPDVPPPAEPRVIVVSAAGAVGKSTLAREIAHSRKAPLWDLAVAGPIAARYSLSGLLQTGFGIRALPDVYRQLAGGELALVIDALDEARVKATEAAFEAFLLDVATIARSSAGISFLLLGRTQIAETVWLVLEDARVSCRLLTIEPFSHEQAEEYIERRVRSGGGRGAQLLAEHPEPFARARDLIFHHLERAITAGEDDREAGSFLGYAPVLDAIAVMLAKEENFSATVQELQQGLQAAEPTHTAVLDRVVERVLIREQEEKLLHNLRPSLASLAAAAAWTDWGMLYTKQEQCVRLAARILGIESGITVVMPRPLLRVYEEAVAALLPEHAFLVDGSRPANVVFESYLFAYVLLDGTRNMAEAVERRLGDPSYKPSRLFADFYMHLNLKRGSKDIPSAHVGWLYDALLSAETESLHVSVSLDGPEPRDAGTTYPVVVEGEFAWHALGDDSMWRLVRSLEFRTTMAMDDVVKFSRYIRRASITVPSRVVFGHGGAEFEIGPNVNVNCGTIELLAQGLVVGGHEGGGSHGGDQDDAVLLEARTYSGTLAARPVARVPLTVNWPGAEAFPWNDHKGQMPRELGRDARMHETYRRFRRIVMTLQSHSRGSLARTKKKIEHERVMRGRLGWALLEQLIRDGVLVDRDGLYHWVPAVAAERVGVSWQQLRHGEASNQLNSYLFAFIEANPDLYNAA